MTNHGGPQIVTHPTGARNDKTVGMQKRGCHGPLRGLAITRPRRVAFSYSSLRGRAYFALTKQSLVPRDSTNENVGNPKERLPRGYRTASRNDEGGESARNDKPWGNAKREIASGLKNKPLAMTTHEGSYIATGHFRSPRNDKGKNGASQ